MTPWEQLREDVYVVFDRDPAARSVLEIVLTYPGVHALLVYRLSHCLWGLGAKLLARLLSHLVRIVTGVDIHPGATIGRRLFIDHGMGVVIGACALGSTTCRRCRHRSSEGNGSCSVPACACGVA